jgi:hypothetical protein
MYVIYTLPVWYKSDSHHLSNTDNRVLKLPRSIHDRFTTCKTRTTLLLCPLPSLSYNLIVSRYRFLSASLSPCTLITCYPQFEDPFIFTPTTAQTHVFYTPPSNPPPKGCVREHIPSPLLLDPLCTLATSPPFYVA